jgi:hypothetical protein
MATVTVMCEPGEAVSVSTSNGGGASGSADAQGKFEYQEVFSGQKDDLILVTAQVGSTGDRTVQTHFTVLSAPEEETNTLSLTIEPSEGPAGTQVEFLVEGAQPGEAITFSVKLGDQLPVEFEAGNADADGKLTYSYVFSGDVDTVHEVTAKTGQPDQEKTASATFKITESVAAQDATVVQGTVNQNAVCRQGNSTLFPMATNFQAGDTVNVIGKDEAGEWYLIQLDGQNPNHENCWIFAQLVSVENPDDIAVVDTSGIVMPQAGQSQQQDQQQPPSGQTGQSAALGGYTCAELAATNWCVVAQDTQLLLSLDLSDRQIRETVTTIIAACPNLYQNLNNLPDCQ